MGNGEAYDQHIPREKNQRNSLSSFFFSFRFQFKHLQKQTKSKVKIDDESYNPKPSNKAKLDVNKF